MSIAATPLAQGHFEIRFRPPASAQNSDAWQKLIGQKPIGARLEGLPEHRTNWRALATSTFTQISIVILLLLLQVILPQNLITKVEYVVTPLAGPMVEIPKPTARPMRPKVQPQPIQAPEPQHIAKLIAPHPLAAPKPKPVELKTAEIPKMEQAAMVPKLDVPDSQPVKPREVKTGLLGDSPAGSGFGDPHGLPGAVDPSKRVNIAHVGAFDSNVGPGNGTGVGGSGGRGNGNVVVGSGFGNSATFASGKSNEGSRTVQSSGFQSAEVVPATPVKSATKAADIPPPTESVAILSKPNPVYTDEARRLGIEGEVLLDVVFQSSGQIKIIGVLKGLGHGLDEAAVRAAQQIRFKPAVQDGHAADFPATVHIVFQLAF
jgi:TonB family protein